jgi:rhamnogalacturonyl hydrolase YesR
VVNEGKKDTFQWMVDYRKAADSLLKWAKGNQYSGEDYYWKSKECYPMALGYFLRAACTLSRRFPKDAFYSEVAGELTSLTLSRSNLLQTSRFHHWGLPFPWPTVDDTENVLSGDFFWDESNPLFSGPLPAHCGYGVTTAIVGQGLIDSFELTGSESLRDVIEQVGNWCVEDCGYRLIDEKVFFNYAPAMRHEIYNGSALVAAFMARAGKLLGKAQWIELAKSAMGYISDVQDEEGGWDYAKERREIEYHYGYNLESLAIYHEAENNPIALDALILGANYYWDRLIDPDGKCYDNNEKLTETRLWAYGWAISAFLHVTSVTGDQKYVDYAKTIAGYMMKNLWVEEVGAFRFKKGEEAFYMRDEAHAAYGLALLAVF